MNSVTFQDRPASPASENQTLHYRAISKAAVTCLVFSVLGLTAFLDPVFVILPALGFGFGLVALLNFRRYPGELIGKLAAQIGLVISVTCLLTSIVHHVYVYNTEVPEGYQRISYGLLRDNTRTPLPFSENAKELDGKKVFLKGYVRPGDKKKNLKNFILVGDFGECCFGGNPKITEVVAISILDGQKSVDYGYGLRRIGGTFRLSPQTALTSEKDIPQVFYVIEADHVK